MPSLLPDYEYAIAIQVKDYEGLVGEDVIRQINKADAYWKSENIRLIEKWIIVTRAFKEKNLDLTKCEGDVRIVFAGELKELLSRIGKTFVNLN